MHTVLHSLILAGLCSSLPADAAFIHDVPLDGDLGDVAGDLSGILSNGSWVGGAPEGPSPAGGLKFTGTRTSYATLEGATLGDLNATGTVMAWVRKDAEAGSNWFLTLGGDPFTFLLAHGVAGSLWAEFKNAAGTGNLAVLTAPLPPTGEWHHVALSWDMAQVALYVDGVMVDDQAIAGPSLSRTRLYLGSTDQNNDRVFNGVLDEVRVYDEFLDEAAVQAAMSPVPIGAPVFPDPAVWTAIDAGSNVWLEFLGDPGVAYNLEWSTNQWSPSWIFNGRSLTGAVGPVSFSDSGVSRPATLYRLALKPPTAVPGGLNHDFAQGSLEGWLVTGEAFSATRDNQGLLPWKGDYHLWANEFYASSDLGISTGTMKSATFPIATADPVTFYLAGVDGPDPVPLGLNVVRLIRTSDFSVLFEALCPQTSRWQRVAWDVFDHVGTEVFIDVVDGNDSPADGWIAVDDFEVGADTVLAPWPPITTTGDTVSCWGRSYHWGTLPLPDDVQSQGTPLLAGPIRLDATVSGQPVVWTAAGTQPDAALTTASGAAAAIRRSAEGGGIRVDGLAVMEFDGMIRIDLALSPVAGAVSVDHLYLDIPFDPQAASLMYLYYIPLYGTRTAGATASFSGPFHPICWLGNEERGLLWFAESDEGWLPTGNADAVKVIPGAQDTVLQLRLWDQPHTLDGPRTFTMGFQASPVKPLPADWHQRSITGNIDWYGGEGTAALQEMMSLNVKVVTAGENWAAIQNYPEAWCCRNEVLQTVKLQSAGTIPLSTWKHVAASWDADTGTAVLYLDGVAVEQVNNFQGLSGLANQSFVIGGDMNVNQSRQFDGVMDEVRVYDRFLDAGDVAAASAGPAPAGPAGLIHAYAFEEGSGSTVGDAVGSEHGTFGAAKTGADWTTGKYGGGLRFRGVDAQGRDHVDFGADSSFDLPTRGTVMAWIREISHDSESFFLTKGRTENFPYMLQSSTFWNGIVLEISTGQFYCPCDHPADDVYDDVVNQVHAWGMKTIPYFGFLYSDIAPEYDLYRDESLRTPVWPDPYRREASGGKPPQEAFDVCNRSRYTDLLLDGIEQVRDTYGIDGVYLDATTLAPICENRLHGCGTVGNTLRGTYPIFPTRSLMKRLSALFPEDQGGIIEAHTQMGVMLPAVSFATSILDGEWFYSLGARGQHILDYASLESHRAHFGPHWGVRTRLLDPTPNPWSEEELMSITMLQDVLMRPSRGAPGQLARIMTLKGVYAAFGADQADWFGYWDNQAVVSSSHPAQVKTSFFRRADSNSVLLVVSNLGNGDLTGVNVTLDLAALGLGSLSTGTMYLYAGGSQPVAVSHDTVTVGALPKWTPRLIVLQ